MMEKVKFSVTTTIENKNRIGNVKNDLTYDQLFTFLLDSLDILENTAKGEVKAELQLKKFLTYGNDEPITPSVLRAWCNVNLNTCKKVCERYADQIEQFNNTKK